MRRKTKQPINQPTVYSKYPITLSFANFGLVGVGQHTKTHTHTHTHTYIYIYIYMCVCVCVCGMYVSMSCILVSERL